MSTKVTFAIMAVFAIGSFILFIQRNSYYADTHKAGNYFTAGGVICAIVALILLAKVIKNSNGSGNAGVGSR